MKHARAWFVIVLAVVGCGKDKTASEAREKPASGSSGSAPAAAGLGIDHVTLLHQESVFGARAPDTKRVAATIKDVEAAITAYDTAHAGVLPVAFDVVLVVRPAAMRAWFVDEAGDVTVPDLEAAIAKLPRFDVSERNVAVVLTMFRAGTTAPARQPLVPRAWKASAGSGVEIDEAIDKAWPR